MTNKIYKVDDYFRYNKISKELIESIDHCMVSESKYVIKKHIIDSAMSDISLNISLIGVFGSGVGAFYPIVNHLISGIDISGNREETIVLMIICAMTIIYLEEKKLSVDKHDKIVKDSKYMLEELKLRGVGNGIVKKIIKSFQAIKNLFSIIVKHLGSVVSGFIDMITYTSLLIPVMNAIFAIIGKYDLTFDNLIENFTGLSIGVGTIFTKHLIGDVINRLKIKYPYKKEVLDGIDIPMTNINISSEESMDEFDIIKEQ